MNKKLAGLVGAFALAMGLSACGANEETGQQVAAPSTTATSPQAPEKIYSVGDKIPITCFSHLPCDGDLKITSMVMSDECKQGYDDYGFGVPELEEGQTYLQIEGEFELRTGENGWTMLEDPSIIDGEGFTQLPSSAVYCREEADYEMWSTTLDVGQKSRNYGAWIVPEDATHMLIHDVKIELPENDEATELAVENVTSSTFVEEALEEATFPSPASETATEVKTTFEACWELEAALMSDGSIIYDPVNCSSEKLAELYGGATTTEVREPSPWVQGQIDWTECLEQGNSEDQCREILN